MTQKFPITTYTVFLSKWHKNSLTQSVFSLSPGFKIQGLWSVPANKKISEKKLKKKDYR